MTSFISSSAGTAKILSKLFRVFGQYPLYLSRFIQLINEKQNEGKHGTGILFQSIS
jgi:hypothetical protein